MIDDSDADFALLASMNSGPGCALVGLVLAIVLWIIAANNRDECSQRQCAHGTPKVMAHECVCVEEPRP